LHDRPGMDTQLDSRPRSPRARPLVLIADGHGDTRELYAVSLASFGFQTMTANDGVQVLARVSEAKPDVIVTDLSLPRQGGWSVVGQLKRDRRTQNIPIVVLTGDAEPSLRERASREGCAALLLKPYLPEELAHALRELLGSAS
jgi:CheY-like chemotaxis protein